MEAVLHQWKDFNLEGLRTTLDAQASGIGDYQDASSESRKKLAEATKKFRGLAVDVKLKSVGPLLKSYQEEIDRLTLRSSFAEKAFLALYKPLSELPDPVLGLNRATARTHRTCPALPCSLSLSLCVCVCVCVCRVCGGVCRVCVRCVCVRASLALPIVG